MAASRKMPLPTGFLCYASENRTLARRIATSLHKNGVETFFDEWEVGAGDSIRAKIDQGLADCTHFIALLTPESIAKPWVSAEMDAAFVQKVEGTSKFIPLRFGLSHKELPPLLKALHSPEITEAEYENDIKSLVHDIFGVSRRPPLGPAPALLPNALVAQTGFSQAALRIAQYFVQATEHAYLDPQLTIDELCSQVALRRDDVVDGLDELERIRAVTIHKVMTGTENHHLMPIPRLFARFDKYWMSWDPEVDATAIASRLLANPGAGMRTELIAAEFGWPVRRLNPALSVLVDANAVRTTNEKSHPEIKNWMQATDATRRFVKSRS